MPPGAGGTARSGTTTTSPATIGAPDGWRRARHRPLHGVGKILALDRALTADAAKRRDSPRGSAIRAKHLQDIVVRRASTPYNSAVSFTSRAPPNHRRPGFRIAIHPTHRPPPARAVGVFRDSAVRYAGRRDRPPAPGRDHPVGRSQERVGGQRAEVRAGGVRGGRPDPRHLLRDAADDGGARRRRGAGAASRVRSRQHPHHAERPVVCVGAGGTAGLGQSW